MSSNNIDDEALARMMQELEYVEAAHARRRDSINNGSANDFPIPSAPPRTDSFGYGGTGTATTSATSNSSAENDEEYARRLQEELRSEEFMVPPAPAQEQAPRTDVQMALKVEQEMRDEEMARQMERADMEAAGAQRAAQVQQAAQTSPQRQQQQGCTCRRILTLLIPTILAVATGVVLYVVFSGNTDSIPFLGGNENDPFNGKNPEDLYQWQTNDVGGLNLELLNALDDNWQNEFDQAVFDWENGTPDALTLTKTTITPESRCSPVSGKMKVCNGDYGDTGWRGINQLIISNGWITNSVAKVNEYYLSRSTDGDRQYTMCHEIGHGFGLPHTDENFNNADLGNCMDYTNNPDFNKQPDETNYELLADFYGTVQPDPARHRLRGLSEAQPLPSDVLTRYLEADDALVNGLDLESEGWRILVENDYTKVEWINLGSGFAMEVHLLRA